MTESFVTPKMRLDDSKKRLCPFNANQNSSGACDGLFCMFWNSTTQEGDALATGYCLLVSQARATSVIPQFLHSLTSNVTSKLEYLIRSSNEVAVCIESFRVDFERKQDAELHKQIGTLREVLKRVVEKSDNGNHLLEQIESTIRATIDNLSETVFRLNK